MQNSYLVFLTHICLMLDMSCSNTDSATLRQKIGTNKISINISSPHQHSHWLLIFYRWTYYIKTISYSTCIPMEFQVRNMDMIEHMSIFYIGNLTTNSITYLKNYLIGHWGVMKDRSSNSYMNLKTIVGIWTAKFFYVILY